ncbi:MAG: VOC family protein [Phycisphaerae bacterium]|nr:VOC family protein [Phycisphaerae bacterium]
MTIRHVHETVLYANDVVDAARFYVDILGLRAVGSIDADGAAFRLPEGDAVLLLFAPAYARREGRGVPAHGADGAGHVAFRVAAGSLDAWSATLARHGVLVEMDRTWQRGGRSIYVRDPAGNSVELVDGTIWAA